ncbi:MAG TPA: serine/threonine-protein kinase [Gemmataceae bacterium]|nr:serine/threonine-protein kinase [Gemmataceae bacterium]
MNESHRISDADSASSHEAATVPPAAPPSEQATQSHLGPAPSAVERDSPPGYEILRELGRGGMGVVYQARHVALDRVVALKMILAGGHAGAADLARFKTEAEAVARLQHPNIVQIFEVGEHGGLPFFSLEFCGGGSLDKKLNGTPLPPKEAAALVETLARAMQAAHDKGVIHRDLKPANVLLAEDGTPKITDFGLAKKLDADLGQTRTGSVMGTPSYMAPEQAGGKSKEMGPLCDVYSLGAILYECLTGRPPFRAATPLDTMMQVVSDDPVPPRQLQSKTPRDLETICLKCLEKQPGRRHATAAELAEDLGRWQRGEPVRAQPPSMGYVLGKQIRRYRTPLTVAAGMLLLLAAVVTTAFVLLLGAWGTAQKNFETADKNGRDLKQALGSLNKQLTFSARLAARRSDAELHAGNLRDSLNWMLNAYELAPRDDPARPRYLRPIGVWGRGLSGRAFWHDDRVTAASFSPDGRLLVTASCDHTARLWDVASGKELQRFLHDGAVNAASFSPDGRLLVTASSDETARVWDLASGKERQRLQPGGQVYAASFSPDGRLLVTASNDRTAWLWDLASGKELQRFQHDQPVVVGASFSPDGRTVLTASYDNTARLWDAATGNELQRFKHNGGMFGASFSPDGRMVITANFDDAAELWDAAGKELQSLKHDPLVTSNRVAPKVVGASFSPDGRRVLTACDDGTARLWDVASGKELERLLHAGTVIAASFSPDGAAVVTANEKSARVWDVVTATELPRLARKVPGADNLDVVTMAATRDARINQLGGPAFFSIPDDVDPDRLRAWVLVRTGQDFTAEGTLHPLSKEEWEQQRQTLDAKGGDWQPPPDPRQWHLIQAADAEAHQAWFAARFHLDWLLKDDPTNADLLRRRNEAEAHLKAP